MSKLPGPVTVQDTYLAAILAELQEISALLASPPVPPEIHIQTASPSTPAAPAYSQPVGSGPKPLPEDFPGRKALADAGVNHYVDVPRTVEELTAIKGIGPATAAEIGDVLHL